MVFLLYIRTIVSHSPQFFWGPLAPIPACNTALTFPTVGLYVGTVSGRARLGRRTEVIYVDLGYWAISGSIHPKGNRLAGNEHISIQRL